MSKNGKVIDLLSNFVNLYVLIFGAIMVILGVQFIIVGLIFSQIEAVCVSVPLILIGGLFVMLMLQDKVYHRVFYKPAYQDYYSQPAYPPQPSFPAQSPYPPASSYGQPPAYSQHPQPPIQQQPQPAYQQPPPQPTYPQQPRPSYQQQPTYQQPYYSPKVPTYHQDSRQQQVSTGPEPPSSPPPSGESEPPISSPIENGQPSSRTEDLPSSDPSQPPPLPTGESAYEPDIDPYPESHEEATDAIPYARDIDGPHATDSFIGDHATQDPYRSDDAGFGDQQSYDPSIPVSGAGPSPGYPSPPPAYYPPYYGGYGQPYGTPSYSLPYVAYVQYFRETFSIPHIRSLLIIFLISIIGGSLVLIIGEPVVYLFPFFFIIAFTFPSFLWISYVYHKDILEPESKHGIFIALTWGMFSTLFAIFPNTFFAVFLDIYYPATIALIITAVIVAPINEEFFKPLGLRRVRSEMNSELDGLIYGVTCGMGFAIIENFTYELTFLFSDDSPIVIWTIGSFIRGIGSTIVHAVGAGLIGFTYARIRIAKKENAMNPGREGLSLYGLPMFLAYLVAVILHAAWNGSASITELWSTDLGVVASILGHIIVFALSFHIIKSLADEGIRRDIERHKGAQYLNPVEAPDQVRDP